MPLQSNFIEITLRLGCSPVNLRLIFRTPFPENTSGGLLLFRDLSSPENNAFCQLSVGIVVCPLRF